MTPCAYVRRVDDGFEYGHIIIKNTAAKDEKREHIPTGTKPTIDEALSANSMALKGAPRLGQSKSAPFTWSDLYDPKLATLSDA